MHANQANTAHIAQLVARAKQGDHQAFDALVEACTPQVYNLALRITGSRDEAEDCVQESFLRAFSNLRGFRGEAAFPTWLYRVALNVANDAARRRSRQPIAASDLADPRSDDPPPDLDRVAAGEPNPDASPEQSLLQHQRRRVILRAIRSLPDKHRTVIILYDLQHLPYEEIARITNTRVGTVKSRLNRARLALRDLLAPHMELLRE